MPEVSHTLWNLFLDLIPVALGVAMGYLWWKRRDLRSARPLWIGLGILWLAFLPNTAYLITEWRHFIQYLTSNPGYVRSAMHDQDALYDFLTKAAFYVIYSAVGVISFSASIWPIAQIAKPNWTTKAIFFLLCALGVYLGLVRRLNTWDLLRHPHMVVNATLDALTRPSIVFLTVAFAALLWFNYWLFEVFVDGLFVRVRRARALRASSQAV